MYIGNYIRGNYLKIFINGFKNNNEQAVPGGSSVKFRKNPVNQFESSAILRIPDKIMGF